MCPSSKRLCVLAMALPILLASAPPQPRPGPSRIDRIQRLVRAAFPELQDPSMRVLLSIEDGLNNDWDSVGPMSLLLMPNGERPKRPEDQLLGGFFTISEREDFIERAYFNGQYVSAPVLYKLQDDIQAHPDWSMADIASALAPAGARYGPGRATEFATELNVTRFEPALGKILTSHIQFSAPRETGEPFLPSWVVTLETAGTHGNRNCYSLVFEPINGRLLSLTGRACT